MAHPTVVLSGKDIRGLEEIAKRYALIGRTFQENVHRLGLDEEINQLLEFARNVGCELQSPDTRTRHNPCGC